jgi:hypothetical protein
VPDFRPAGGKGDEDSAATLDGLHRADSFCFKAAQARDNAFIEGTAGGFGAYRLTNEWADPYDKDSDHQRINPGYIITDADQRVFFDPDDETYDKSKSQFGFVITAKQRQAFEEQYPDAISDWTVPRLNAPFDWFTPDVVKVAEYYEVEDHAEKLLILTHALSSSRNATGRARSTPTSSPTSRRWAGAVKVAVKRKRVHKYLMSGEEVIADKGLIAGDRIPIAPYYGKPRVRRRRRAVRGLRPGQDGRSEALQHGGVEARRDERPIPARNPDLRRPSRCRRILPICGQTRSRAPCLCAGRAADRSDRRQDDRGRPDRQGRSAADRSRTAAVIQIARNDLTADQQDGSEQVQANTSEEAMAFAATRVDAKSGIYLDNWRQTVQCEGEIYLCMSADVYFEPGREVETMSDDGNDGTAKLVQQYVDGEGQERLPQRLHPRPLQGRGRRHRSDRHQARQDGQVGAPSCPKPPRSSAIWTWRRARS